jgi:hypothetical protein
MGMEKLTSSPVWAGLPIVIPRALAIADARRRSIHSVPMAVAACRVLVHSCLSFSIIGALQQAHRHLLHAAELDARADLSVPIRIVWALRWAFSRHTMTASERDWWR